MQHQFPENFTPAEPAILDSGAKRRKQIAASALEGKFQGNLVDSRPIALDYLSWDAPPGTDLNAGRFSPLPDGLGVCLAG